MGATLARSICFPGPACQSAIVRCSAGEDGAGSSVLFSGIAEGPRTPPGGRRAGLTIFLSQDECETWPISRVLHAGPAAYSDLVALPDGTVLCVYEGGEEHAYESIRLARFGIDWVLGQDQDAPQAGDQWDPLIGPSNHST